MAVVLWRFDKINANDDFAFERELHRVTEEVHQQLTDARRVASMTPTDPRINERHQLNALLISRAVHQASTLVDQLPRIELNCFEFELAGFDLREIEDVIEHRQQRIGRRLDRRCHLALVIVEFGPQQQLGHAENTVHRSANLMAHIGQELCLRNRFGHRALTRRFEIVDLSIDRVEGLVRRD